MSKTGTLYLVPCPISEAAPYSVLPADNKNIIRQLDYFIVENLRSARRFLSRAEIGKPIDSLSFAELNEHTPAEQIEDIIQPLLQGKDAGIISEAGIPGVADPGADVVALCHRKGIRVIPLVGPCSIILALMASGLNGQSFAFNGYLPVKPDERKRSIKHFERRARTDRQSQIFIETPYRNIKLYQDILAVCEGQTLLTLAVDIQGKDELIRTAPVSEWKKIPAPDINKRPAIFIIL